MIYLFENPETKEIKEIVQLADSEHSYEENGIKYNRVFTIPYYATDTKIDPYSKSDFVKSTNKKGTIGDLIDKSQELSQKRGGMTGKDEMKEKAYESYAKTRNGALHPDVIKRKSKEKLDKLGVTIEA